MKTIVASLSDNVVTGLHVAVSLLLSVGGSLPASAQESPPATTISIALPTAPLLVHLDQVALERHGPKSAIVESTGDATTGTYRILMDGKIVTQGALQPLPGFSAWGTGKRYFRVDFSGLARPGSYRVDVETGGQRAASAPVEVKDRALFSTIAASALAYFRSNRHTGEGDHRIRVFDSDRVVDVWGGWKDAGGDTGKYLSHLGYANYFNPQQTPMVAWVLAYGAHARGDLYRQAGLYDKIEQEAFWGADYLHRILDPEGYFYTTVFDRWGTEGAERMIVGYEGEAGTYTTSYRSAFRAGGGMAIAALARASMLARQSGRHGELTGDTYLADAVRAYDHLKRFNLQYCADGRENIIDDYAALMATTELFRATGQPRYLEDARHRAAALMARQAADGGFASDDGQRPYYHAVEAGFPVVSLAWYLDIETEAARQRQASDAIARALRQQIDITRRVSNPYGYARQAFRLARDGHPVGEVKEGFFIPHQNETGYWWQGESARLASLSAAMVLGGRRASPGDGGFGLPQEWATFAQEQIDWTLGRNPYGISMLYGFGVSNPPTVAESAGDMVVGGISNGITGAADSDDGLGIAFAPGPDSAQWRWVEQWLPHTTWMLFAAMAMASDPLESAGPPSEGDVEPRD